jgi:asparagine synthase (glutamine-hydrolysing)
MCGIAGFFSSNQLSKNTLRHVTDMLASIKHRGPDSEGVEIFESGTLGHVRLAIRDLSPLGFQPMLSDDGRYGLVYNGELYNTEELTCYLKSEYKWAPKGTSDTEVLLYLLKFEGVESTLKRIKGMFAFAFIDQHKNSLFLARDQIGIKPLYYILSDSGEFAFCSEFKGLLKSNLSHRNVSRSAVATLFERNYIPSPQTLYTDISKLEPGHYITVDLLDLKSMELTCYYKTTYGSNEQSLDDIDNALRDTVEKHLLADVEIGCFLSGGVDSSLIATYASQCMDTKLKTYTISFDQSEFDESKVAERIAQHLGTDHTTFNLKSTYMDENIESILRELDEPFADSSFIPTFIVSKLASEHVKVCLSGDGGDEAFLGYDKYRAYPKVVDTIEKYGSVLKFIPNVVLNSTSLANVLPFKNVKDKVSKAISMAASQDKAESMRVIDAFWHTPPISADYTKHDYRLLDYSLKDSTDIINDLDIKYYLPDDLLVKSDIASMRNSLELRVPFLYLDVFNLGVMTSSHLKLSKTQGKTVLRDIQRKYLPVDIADMPKKGFRVPLARWLRENLREFSEKRIRYCLHKLAFIDESKVNEKWQEHLNEECDNSYWLWSIIVLGNWLMEMQGENVEY